MLFVPNKLVTHIPHGHCNDELSMDWQSFFTRVLMKVLKRIYGRSQGNVWSSVQDVLPYDESVDFIRQKLLSKEPFMAGKIGTGDMETLQRYIDMISEFGIAEKWLRLIAGKSFPFWLDNWIRAGICVCAGVFPATDESINEFCRIFMSYCNAFDVIPKYTEGDKRIYDKLCPTAKVIDLRALAPDSPNTWYSALEGKRVLVVHQYVKTIKAQYEKNVEFHKGQGPLPRFKELIQYRPVNSIGGKCKEFSCWKDALQHMIDDISKIDFDVALLGCGVYGVPLSAHIKRMGKQAIYTGGATQIIFGIKGKRWDNLGIYNEHWTRVLPDDIPENMSMIEGGTFL